jgi:hypothetical protein
MFWVGVGCGSMEVSEVLSSALLFLFRGGEGEIEIGYDMIG